MNDGNIVGVGVPASYDYMNANISPVTPSTQHVQGTGLHRYFQRYLLQKAISVFEWEMPQTWDKNYFLYVLYCWGYLAIINTDRFGVIPQGCGLKGYNVFYQPRQAVIVNPLLRGINEPVINEQCALLRLQPDYGGIMDVVNYYASTLALAAETLMTNLLNSKLAYVFTAKNKAAAESFKKLFDMVASGEPAVVYDKGLLNADGSKAWDTFSQDIKRTYIATDVISDMRKLEAQFDTIIGIPNANTDKRERLVTDEVNANNFETLSRAALWLEELRKGCEIARNMFGIDLSVDWRKLPESAPGSAPEMSVEGASE